jgi:2-amino-4-hydroxy-6-hydroxymethyldihydropteridine diphosphokinase
MKASASGRCADRRRAGRRGADGGVALRPSSRRPVDCRTRVYVGLGSNIAHPVRQLTLALRALARLPGASALRSSGFYRNPAMGPIAQPDFVNAVACFATSQGPLDLLGELNRIEERQGRVRTAERWGPRSLDLDLLLYGDVTVDEPRLTVPHPGLPERAFVLIPLAELAPDLHIPGRGPLRGLLRSVSREGLLRIGDPP